jgi:hypothetical protein
MEKIQAALLVGRQYVWDVILNLVQRFNRIRKEAITWLNGLFTVLALYVMAHHDVHEKLLPFIPEDYRSYASVALPVFMFWMAQKGKEIDKARTIAETRLP